MALKKMRPRPIRRLNQRRNRLWGLSGQGGVEQSLRQHENLSSRIQIQAVKKPFVPLCDKCALHPQPRSQRLLQQVRPLNPGQHTPIGGALAQRLSQRPPQLFETRILFTMYNSKRH